MMMMRDTVGILLLKLIDGVLSPINLDLQLTLCLLSSGVADRARGGAPQWII